MKKFLFALLASMALCLPAFALEATIPQFDVYIGSDKLEFQNADYPLLLYKDITYFPMTYDYIHWLDLTSSWDGSFYIGYHNSNSLYNPVGPASWQSNPKVCEGELARYDIFVNGKQIDNSKEEYPLFNFRGITYFPMTWRFATDEFNLKLYWDGAFHIDKAYESDSVDFYGQQDEKAYFTFGTADQRVNENGDIEYYNFVTRYGFFDCRQKSFGLGKIEAPKEDAFTKGTASIENGILKYDGKIIADVSEFTGKKSSDKDDIASPRTYVLEYEAGNLRVVDISVTANGYPSPHKASKDYIFLLDEGGVTMISGGDEGASVDRIYEIGGKYYLSMRYGNYSKYGYKAVTVEPDGGVTIYKDDDHKSVRIIGEIDGKPLVFATWNMEMGDDVSLVNDGFFTLESDGSLKRYYGFVRYSDSIVVDNTLYLVLDFKGKLLNTSTGEEYDFVAWAEQMQKEGQL